MLKVTDLQQELQSMITEAESEYESNLALAYTLTLSVHLSLLPDI